MVHGTRIKIMVRSGNAGMAPHAKEKNAVPPKQCTVPQVQENDGKME